MFQPTGSFACCPKLSPGRRAPAEKHCATPNKFRMRVPRSTRTVNCLNLPWSSYSTIVGPMLGSPSAASRTYGKRVQRPCNGHRRKLYNRKQERSAVWVFHGPGQRVLQYHGHGYQRDQIMPTFTLDQKDQAESTTPKKLFCCDANQPFPITSHLAFNTNSNVNENMHYELSVCFNEDNAIHLCDPHTGDLGGFPRQQEGGG